MDQAYLRCAEHVCSKHGVEHAADLPYGKGFALINGEFQRVLTKLAMLPHGLFLISHSQERDIETRTGKRTVIVPTLAEKARRIVLGLADLILYFDIEVNKEAGPRRVIRTKPSPLYEAGDRTGRLPETIPMDYHKFLEAFSSARNTMEKIIC